MIGLCRGLAKQAYRENDRLDSWHGMVLGNETFGLTDRRSALKMLYGEPLFPISRRYYQLLDACKLRIRPMRSFYVGRNICCGVISAGLIVDEHTTNQEVVQFTKEMARTERTVENIEAELMPLERCNCKARMRP